MIVRGAMDDSNDDDKAVDLDRRKAALSEVQQQFMSTRERIRQIEAKALRKLYRPRPTD
jgi:DNA-directed RNA polymerase sigma subunit (sigma70/sigma32)